jgi:RNA 2',3'-cyclic 3'-phosphodiesterase
MRLFVALPVPEPSRRDLRRRVDGVRDRLPRARWTDLDNVHLTLLFLGETAEGEVPAFTAALRETFVRHPPLDLRLSSGGTFPPGRPARVAWVGVEAPEELTDLQAGITEAAVATLGFTPEEREFHPHVTLARCPDPWRRDAVDKFTTAFTGPIGPPFVTDRGILFESKLSPKGARYREVADFPLEGTPLEGDA